MSINNPSDCRLSFSRIIYIVDSNAVAEFSFIAKLFYGVGVEIFGGFFCGDKSHNAFGIYFHSVEFLSLAVVDSTQDFVVVVRHCYNPVANPPSSYFLYFGVTALFDTFSKFFNFVDYSLSLFC